MNIKNNLSQVKVKTPNDGDFPELKILNYKEMYDLVTQFIQNVVLIKGFEFAIITRTTNKISLPKLPFIFLEIMDIYHLPDLKTYDVNIKRVNKYS